MPDKFQNKYRIPSARLQTWDYGWNGSYFVTICTANREHYFGKIIDREIQLSPVGKLAQQFWDEIPQHFSFVQLEAFVVMPNHVHGIITINKNNEQTRQSLASKDDSNQTPGEQRLRNPEKHSLSSIIGSYKSIVTKQSRQTNPIFSWQTRFHDHIIRDHEEFARINNYIEMNVENWEDDCFYNNE